MECRALLRTRAGAKKHRSHHWDGLLRRWLRCARCQDRKVHASYVGDHDRLFHPVPDPPAPAAALPALAAYDPGRAARADEQQRHSAQSSPAAMDVGDMASPGGFVTSSSPAPARSDDEDVLSGHRSSAGGGDGSGGSEAGAADAGAAEEANLRADGGRQQQPQQLLGDVKKGGRGSIWPGVRIPPGQAGSVAIPGM
jgi:hypothetical protein